MVITLRKTRTPPLIGCRPTCIIVTILPVGMRARLYILLYVSIPQICYASSYKKQTADARISCIRRAGFVRFPKQPARVRARRDALLEALTPGGEFERKAHVCTYLLSQRCLFIVAIGDPAKRNRIIFEGSRWLVRTLGIGSRVSIGKCVEIFADR